MIEVTDALHKILSVAVPLDRFSLPVEKSLSYYLTSDVTADRPIPPFNRVAMDGFAVQSADFAEQSTIELKIIDQIQTGVASKTIVKAGEAAQIMTGAPCPEGADAVIKIENANIKGDTVELTEKNVKPGHNIAPMGEDAAQGKVLLESGSQITTAGIAVCASVGVAEVEVCRKPKVFIMSTGTEIISPSETPLPHQIRDCNSYALRTLTDLQSAEYEFLGIGEDDPEVLGGMIRKGLEGDILILSGGVSMGEFDHVPKLLSENGVEKIFHHIKMKPGKPVWFGKTDSCFVFGLPGNPVSVQTCFRLFVEPLIKKLSGSKSPQHRFLKLPLATEAFSKTNRENFIPGRFSIREESTAIEPVIIRGSGDFSNFANSDGLFRFPSELSRMEAGDLVDFLPWREIW